MEDTSFFKQLEIEPNSVRLFEKGDVYFLFGSDAMAAAPMIFKTTSVVKYAGDKTPYLQVSKGNVTLFLKEVIDKMSVFIYKMERSKWTLDRKSTPGNVGEMEDLLDVVCESTILACRCVRKAEVLHVYTAFSNSPKKIRIAEFVDTDTFCNLLSLLTQTNAKEVLIAAEQSLSFESSQMAKALDKTDIVISKIARQEFDSSKVYKTFDMLPESAACVSALGKYLGLDMSVVSFSNYNMEEFMKVHVNAIRSLHLLGPKSLFSVLNQCQTSQGSRLLEQFIRLPLISVAEIESRHNLVNAFFQDSQLMETVRGELRFFPDLYRLAKRFQKQKGNLQDVVRIYQVLLRIPSLVEALDSFEGEEKGLVKEKFIDALSQHSESLDKLKEMIETTVDLEAADRHEYLIKADFDEDLQQLRTTMDDLSAQMEADARQVADDLGLEFEKKLKFEKSSIYGHHMRLTRIDATKIRGKGFIELSTQKSGVFFTTSPMKSLSQEFVEAEEKYKAQQSTLVKEVLSITAGYFAVLDTLNDTIAFLDVIQSFAYASSRAPIPYIRPTMQPKGGLLRIKNGRHPSLEVQEGVSFIPNDTEMTRNESSFHIITGPNMGGKSTYIRQNATPDSLVIIDELGRGTSTSDGFGLAWAIAEHIATKITCFTLFATHFHEITALANRFPIVKNKHVQVHTSQKDMVLLYKLKDGVCDQSFGIHVAAMAEFPDVVVRVAKRKLQELEGQ